MRLLDSGRDADVYAVGDGLVLRTYRTGGDVAAEAARLGEAVRLIASRSRFAEET